MSALTKLRLITNKAMVDAAKDLHAADHGFVEAATASPRAAALDLDFSLALLWRARRQFLAAGKRTIGLSGSRAVRAFGRPL